MKLTAEQIVKAKTAKSVEELITLAKAEGIEATEEEIKAKFDAMHKEGEVADEELANANGGSQCKGGKTYSSDAPYNLIVTRWNSCPAYIHNSDLSQDSHACETCYHVFEKGLTMYCWARRIDDDPYR